MPASAGFLLQVERQHLDLSVIATNLVPRDVVTLSVAGTPDVMARADASGRLEVTVPGIARGCGRRTVLARTTHSGGGVGSWEDICRLIAPVLSVSPQIVQEDTQSGYDVAGTGFIPGVPYVVEVDGIAQGVASAPSPDKSGDFPVRVEPGPLTCGLHLVAVSQPDAKNYTQGPASASAPVLVDCPTVTVDPASVARDDQPVTVRVSGRGVDFLRSAQVLLDGRPAGTADVAVDGSVETSLPADGLACGPHTVTLVAGWRPATTTGIRSRRTDDVTMVATTLLTITCPGSGVPVVPVLTATPSVVERGRLVEVTGTGFPAGPVAVVVAGRSCAVPVASTGGGFTTTCVVHDLGRLVVTAAAAAKATATTDLLAVPGPMEPGRHGFLVRR